VDQEDWQLKVGICYYNSGNKSLLQVHVVYGRLLQAFHTDMNPHLEQYILLDINYMLDQNKRDLAVVSV
jgi:hypothetical protein